MSKRWSWSWWNDWRWVGRDLINVKLVEAHVEYGRGRYAYVELGALGFGISLCRYAERAPSDGWGQVIGAAASMYGAEPVESLGREHADGAA